MVLIWKENYLHPIRRRGFRRGAVLIVRENFVATSSVGQGALDVRAGEKSEAKPAEPPDLASPTPVSTLKFLSSALPLFYMRLTHHKADEPTTVHSQSKTLHPRLCHHLLPKDKDGDLVSARRAMHYNSRCGSVVSLLRV